MSNQYFIDRSVAASLPGSGIYLNTLEQHNYLVHLAPYSNTLQVGYMINLEDIAPCDKLRFQMEFGDNAEWIV